MNKNWIMLCGTIIVLFVGVLYFGYSSNTQLLTLNQNGFTGSTTLRSVLSSGGSTHTSIGSDYILSDKGTGLIVKNKVAVKNPAVTDSHATISPDTSSEEVTHIFAADLISRFSNDNTAVPGERYVVSVRHDHIGPTKGNVEGNVIVNYIPVDGKKIPSQGDGSTKLVFFTKYDPQHDWYTIVKISIYIIDIQSAADFSDDKVLMGASHNIFIGKVTRQIGSKGRGIGPETQFQVAVIDNIKGDLHGTVTVDQQGGYKDGVLYIVDDDYPLQPGSTYLFATRYNPQQDWYTLNPYPTARKLLSGDASALEADIKALSANDSRVQELKAAYPHEILLDADIKHNNTRNSYKAVQMNQTASVNATVSAQ